MDSINKQPSEVTQLLLKWSDGDKEALEMLIPLVYDELYRLARSYMNREQAGHTLQITALVNEAYLRLVNWKDAKWENRAHFFGVAAQLMRRILVDFARSRNYEKRGGGLQQVAFDEAVGLSTRQDADFVSLDDGLKSLAEIDQRKARVVELKFFGGLSVEEIAEVLDVSPRTVMREWNLARAWLFRELRQGTESVIEQQ
ncbi:MAG: sigma-70 family RNA polymerase sigma factor [Acidobacteria bacterium]|nr:sigma-70 family RNA polymerase sigma factor [Acidobacteriota bacterium]